MKRTTPFSRPTAILSDSVHQQLNKYALAAGAAGVSLLAPAQPSDAKVVYTAAHVVLKPAPFVLPLDLNHDGIPDFYLAEYPFQLTAWVGTLLGIQNLPKQTNQWIRFPKGVADLPYGFAIGPSHGEFEDKAGAMAVGAWRSANSTQPIFEGLWARSGKGVQHRYLGLKFTINGEVHYGWARLSVTFPSITHFPYHRVRTALTVYAYETIANQAINAGQTTGADKPANLDELRATLSAPPPQPATLSLLALGAPALAIWRREESATAAQ